MLVIMAGKKIVKYTANINKIITSNHLHLISDNIELTDMQQGCNGLQGTKHDNDKPSDIQMGENGQGTKHDNDKPSDMQIGKKRPAGG